jgi:hypothetical protein
MKEIDYMGQMKHLWEDINYLLDTTKFSCEEIANSLSCPVDWVNEIVEQRWIERVGKLVDEEMSPHATMNS